MWPSPAAPGLHCCRNTAGTSATAVLQGSQCHETEQPRTQVAAVLELWPWHFAPKGKAEEQLFDSRSGKKKTTNGPTAPGGTPAASGSPSCTRRALLERIYLSATGRFPRWGEHSTVGIHPGVPHPKHRSGELPVGLRRKDAGRRYGIRTSRIDPKAADTEAVLNVPSTAPAAAKPSAPRGSHPQPHCRAPSALLQMSRRRPNVVIPSARPSPASLLQGKGTRRHLMRRGVRSNCAE